MKHSPIPRFLTALLIAALWQILSIVRVSQTLQSDSFLTLSPLGASGLVLLMFGLVAVLLIVNARVCNRIDQHVSSTLIALPLCLLTTFLLFTFFWGISPQVFYLYYQLLFDNLPMQWVVRDGFPIRKSIALMHPGNNTNTSDLSASITLIFLLAYTALAFRKKNHVQRDNKRY